MSQARGWATLGELFRLATTGERPVGVPLPAGLVWLYPCVLCNALTVVEPGELCTDCGGYPFGTGPRRAPAPRRRRTTAKASTKNRKVAKGGKTAMRAEAAHTVKGSARAAGGRRG
jgi:hypothetical protein